MLDASARGRGKTTPATTKTVDSKSGTGTTTNSCVTFAPWRSGCGFHLSSLEEFKVYIGSACSVARIDGQTERLSLFAVVDHSFQDVRMGNEVQAR